jgi:hypothetical protein
MDPSIPPPQKKGLGALAWLGIGCGGLVVLLIILVAVVGMRLGPALKQFGADAQKNPTKATAEMMVKIGNGQFEMIAEDEPNKRYTIRQKTTGKLMTIYWDAKKKAPVTIEGDFSAIPADANTPAATPESTPPKQ